MTLTAPPLAQTVIPNFGGGSDCVRKNHTFCWDWFSAHWGDTFRPALTQHVVLTLIAVGIGLAIALACALIAYRQRWFEGPFTLMSDERPEEQLLLYAHDLRRLLELERGQRHLLKTAYEETISAFAGALEAKDFGTGAEASFKAVAESVPLNEVFNNLGAAQSRLNEPQTLENLKKALEGDDSDPDYHFNLGSVQWRAGQFAAAADSFRAALARKSDDGEATEMLGRH